MNVRKALLTKSDNGFALAAVLILVAILSLIALALVHEFRTGTKVLKTRQEQLRLEAAYDAAFYRAIDGLLEVGDEDRWSPRAAPYTFEFEGIHVSIRISDEQGRLDVNTASPDHLRKLIAHFTRKPTEDESGAVMGEVDEAEVTRLSDALADWKDEDNRKRRHGAESADYRALGKSVLPRNRPLETVGELHWIVGFDPEVVACLVPHLTVHSHRRSVDTRFVGADLAEILGLTVEDNSAQAVSAIRGGLGGRVLRIEVSQKQSTQARALIVRITEAKSEPYWVLGRRTGARVGRPQDCQLTDNKEKLEF